jgi:hypothetical protein
MLLLAFLMNVTHCEDASPDELGFDDLEVNDFADKQKIVSSASNVTSGMIEIQSTIVEILSKFEIVYKTNYSPDNETIEAIEELRVKFEKAYARINKFLFVKGNQLVLDLLSQNNETDSATQLDLEARVKDFNKNRLTTVSFLERFRQNIATYASSAHYDQVYESASDKLSGMAETLAGLLHV